MSEPGGPLFRDSIEVEALRTDRYLDALLVAAERRATDAPVPAELDPAVRRAIRRLRRDLVRVHPSFRFEERLAARLARAAAGADLDTGSLESPEWDPALAEPPSGHGLTRRPLLLRGAVASAALSLAGAALVMARRRARTPGPMTRAIRAAHRRPGGRSARRRPARARRAPLA